MQKISKVLVLIATVIATALIFLAALPAAEASVAGKSIFFVVGDTGNHSDNDDHTIKDYLESRGASVRMVSDSDTSSPGRDTDLILISSTTDARILRKRFRDSILPVLTWNAYLYPELGMTGDVLHRDFSVVRESVTHNLNHASFYSYCVNAEHPISKAAGLPAGMFLNFMFSGETDMNWGSPTAGADVISISQGDPKKAAVFVYESGSLMHGDFPAPARRAAFFLGDDSFRQLSYAQGPALLDKRQAKWFVGRDLFDATLDWALSAPNPAQVKQSDLSRSLKKAAAGKNLLFLLRENLPWPAGEESDAAHLEFLSNAGFDITVRDQTSPEMDTSKFDLIVISASTNKYKFGVKYSDAPIPVVLLEGKSVDAMKMAGYRRWTDYGTNDHKESDYPPEQYIKIMRPGHRMAAGFDAGLVKIYRERGLITWSIPAPGASIIATIPNQPQSAAIYGYDAGVTMAHDAIAPARRVLFPVDFSRFHQLTEDGLKLYSGVLLWSLGE